MYQYAKLCDEKMCVLRCPAVGQPLKISGRLMAISSPPMGPKTYRRTLGVYIGTPLPARTKNTGVMACVTDQPNHNRRYFLK